MKTSGLFSIFLLVCIHSWATPVLTSLYFPLTVGKYQKFEVDFTFNFAHNPYDYERINTWAEFTAPSGKVFKVYGFYYEGFDKLDEAYANSYEVLAPNGDNLWKVRFSPGETGDWAYTLHVVDPTGALTAPDMGTYRFSVTPTNEKGFISKANNRYLKYDSGEPFIPIGDSYPWWLCEPYRASSNGKEKGTNITKHYLDGMAANGFTYNRFEINLYEGLSLTGRDFVLQKTFQNYYNQHDAWQLDVIMDYAKEKGINFNLALFPFGNLIDHGSFNYLDPGTNQFIHIPDTNSQGIPVTGFAFGCWSLYNAFNKYQDPRYRPAPPDSVGFCANRYEFFSHPKAILAQKKLYRYVVARWGYCTNLMGYELVDEMGPDGGVIGNDLNPYYVPTPPNWNQTLAEWHLQMYDFIKSVDPQQHLVSIPLSDEVLGPMIIPRMDFVNVHWYTDYLRNPEEGLFQPFEYIIADRMKVWAEQYDKPMGIFETGWCAAGICEDPHMYELHNMIWSALFNGSMGLTAIWAHEEEVLGHGALGQFAGVGAFSRLLPLFSEKDVPTRMRANGLKWQYLHNHLSDEFHGWVQDENFTYSALWYGPYRNYLNTLSPSSRPPFKSANHAGKLFVSRPGTYEVSWYNTVTGAFHSSLRVESEGDSITLMMPLELYHTTWADAGFMVRFVRGEPDMMVFPNPSRAIFQIQLKHDADVTSCRYSVFSALGSLVMQDEVALDPESPAFSINLEDYAAGAYFLVTDFGDAHITSKLVKQ